MYSKTTIQHILSNGLFHRVEQSVPWGGTKCSIGWNKVFHGVEHLRTLCLLFLMVVFGGGNVWGQTEITSLSDINDANGNYIITGDIDATSFTSSFTTFSGTLEAAIDPETHMPYRITGLGAPLFTTLTGTVKNLVLEDVSISGNTGNTGAIACTANGEARIYNVGILSGSVGGTGNTGGLVGLLDGTARVINCYSYANITSGTNKGGIVGYNNVASTQSSLKTMVMNCLFYGDISSGETISPIYGGKEINNVAGGLNNYNYYRYESPYSKNKQISVYNRALAMEEKFINRFERYRLLLNSNKKLAAKYASTATVPVEPSDMAKWVLETADRSISGRDPYPYPILKAQGYYPSIINPDIEHAPDNASVGRNHGGKLGKTLTVHIGGVGSNAPTGASIRRRGAIQLQRTDKDFDRFNYNYDKVQLPYYNDVGTGNYTENKVVTGWKITSITGGTAGDYHAGDEWGGYNFADRNCTNKDLYSVSGRVFSQGAYFDVPTGVTGITIEPYWGKAAYVSDQKYDVIYTNSYGNPSSSFTPFDNQYTNGQDVDIHGDGNKQKVYTSIGNARTALGISGGTVYDWAVVLIGNVHQNGDPTNNDTPYTVMSIDLDHDNEPDYSYIFGHDNRKAISPIRYDFLNIVGIAEAQMPKGATKFRNVSIFNLKGWFEITNTCVVNFSQFEYDNSDNISSAVLKSPAPLILLGGTFQQFVSTQKAKTLKDKHTQYIHVGSNAWFAKFGNGTHSDGNAFTPHIPISVTGGDYDEFYLSGTYQPDITTNMQSDNAECYISGGRFGEMAATSLEQIQGDVRWGIDYADITNFYGGGTNANKPLTGSIRVDITNSHVGTYCGGPKFGDMSDEKTVLSNATNCEFGTFFGAGYGGNSYNRVKYYDVENGEPASYQGSYSSDRGFYFDGSTTYANASTSTTKNYGKKGKGVATDFDYEYFIWSSGTTGARFYVKFISFSLATTKNVTSTLNGCTIKNNFYGGGNLGKVDGTATSVLNDCTVEGDVFGGGYSASLPTIQVRKTPAFISGKEPSKNANIGLFEEGEINTTEEYQWKQVAEMPGNGKAGMESGETGNFVYTDADLSTLGQVGATDLKINGTTKVAGSVYGGGEESGVAGDTEVNVTGGTIGTTGKGGARWGNVYGGGKGLPEKVEAGLVKGNTNIVISGEPTIYHNVYGGGAYGSVGDFTYDAKGLPTARKEGTTGGTANITITGGTIGTTGSNNGMVFGSSRGDVATPEGEPAVDPNDRMAWVYSTKVTIGTQSETPSLTTPKIAGSVYGSGENGHTFKDTEVTIHSGTIGIAEGETITDDNGTPNDTSDDKTYSGAAYPYRGNVYGGGCGTDQYTGTDDKKYYNPIAGIVRGNATVTIDGGHVVRNVYGAGAMGSVGNETEAESASTSGKTIVTIKGKAKIGVDGDDNGNVYGAARGDLNVQAEYYANVRETELEINENADVKGSAFGGGEAGIVWENVTVNMLGGTVAKDLYGGGALANTQIANNNEGNTPSTFTTKVNLKGGTISGNAYGGGLGTSDTMDESGAVTTPGVKAIVYGDVTVDLNKEVADNTKGCVIGGNIFGCNNLNGTPKGEVTVHVYKTQNAEATTIANPAEGEKTAKVKGRYDIAAVYGGGNLAAYEPQDNNAKANVIIDGCELTSIRQVYGGGNAASTPATSVAINGTYEIEELFGGGNGMDDIVLNSITLPNPGANVGYKNYSEFYKDGSAWKVRDKSDADTKEKRQASGSLYVYGSGAASVDIHGGTIHRVFGGSNTKGNVRHTAVTMLEDASGCPFVVDEAYGGGKSASMDAEAKLLMACIPGLNAVYGGAEDADIQDNVTLTITNGTFDRVFGGNNKSGQINGSITVNVEEVGCRPIIIGELYGGGNLAAYSIYGYNTDGTPKTSGENPFKDPEVNVKSFTSIGTVYGGGYGEQAVMVGSPTVNINEVADPTSVAQNKSYIEDETTKYYSDYAGETKIIEGHNVILPSHEKGKMGSIHSVFGGGNAAKVMGDTHVNIGTAVGDDIYMVVPVAADTDLTGGGYYTKSGDTYTEVTSGTATSDTTYYKKYTVLGVDIRDNVYGGGNAAEVTGNTNVTIGKDATN